MMLELLKLPSATMSAASMMSMPTSELLVCRHPCTRALKGNAHIRLLRIACQVVLYTLKGYGVELTNPQACLAVLVAGQRSQASFGAGYAVNPLPMAPPRCEAFEVAF